MSLGPWRWGNNATQLSECAAKWLSVHRVFNANQSQPDSNVNTKIQMHTLSLTPPPYAIRLRFTVNDPDELHQAQLVTDGVIACTPLDGTSNTVEFITTQLSGFKLVTLKVIDKHGYSSSNSFPIDITPLLPPFEGISMPDPNLASAIRKSLNLASGDIITKLHMHGLRKLEVRNRQITDLTGLEHGKNLKILDLGGNKISDVTPLSVMTELLYADLGSNQISDISPLAELTNLDTVWLGSNQIGDITPLAGLTDLFFVGLSRNQISNIVPLTGLTRLEGLFLQYNQITDITPIAALQNLEQLNLGSNSITDITVLEGLTQLRKLRIEWSQVSDISPLVANTGLGEGDMVYVTGNPLNYPSVYTYISVLKERGVEVTFDLRTPQRIRIVSGGNQEGVPSGALANPFVVEVRDENNVAFEGVPVMFTVTSGGGTLSASSTATDVNGRTESTLTLGPKPGANTVTVSVTGIQEKQSFTAEGIQVAKTLNVISGNNLQGQPGMALEKPFVVEVNDQTDKPLPGVQVTFTVSGGGGRLNATTATTDSDGRAESTLTLGPKPGTNTVTVSVTGIQEVQTFSAEGIRIPKTLEIVSGKGQQGPPGSALEKPFVVEVNDQTDKPLPGVQVTFTVSGGGGRLNATTATTDSDGRAESTLTLGPKPGTNTVTVSVTGIQEGQTFTAEGIRTPKAFWIISGFDQKGLVGEALPRPIVVEVRDQSGEPLPGAEVTFSVTNGGGTLSVTTTTTDSDGRAESTLALGLDPGTNTVEVSVTGIQGKQTATAIAELPPTPEDVNMDDVVNILDLVRVASVLGAEGADLAADVNGDGIVNILDLVRVAGALENAAAAPSSWYRDLEIAPTRADVGEWLAQAQGLDLTDATSQRGVLFLEQLLATLIPEETVLLPNYPNPFNPETWIPYRLAEDAFVTLTIYDARGRVVRALEIGHQAAAFYESRSNAIYWDGKNEIGEEVASGVYIYHLSAGGYSATRKMLIVK